MQLKMSYIGPNDSKKITDEQKQIALKKKRASKFPGESISYRQQVTRQTKTKILSYIN